MKTSVVRIGIVGCGLAARIHLDRLLALGGVAIVGCADPDSGAAAALADRASNGAIRKSSDVVRAFTDHRELISTATPDAVAIFSPHLSHYRQSMDALQAGCHVFIEKPLSTNLQEAADIVSLARARKLKVGVGHQFRLCPSLIEARDRIARGVIGPLRLVTCTLARPWLSSRDEEQKGWSQSERLARGGILADAGDHLIDALLWTTGQVAVEVAAIQSQTSPGIDLVTAAAIRLEDGTPVSLAISGVSPGGLFALDYFGELGRLHVTDHSLEEERFDTPWHDIALPAADQTHRRQLRGCSCERFSLVLSSGSGSRHRATA